MVKPLEGRCQERRTRTVPNHAPSTRAGAAPPPTAWSRGPRDGVWGGPPRGRGLPRVGDGAWVHNDACGHEVSATGSRTPSVKGRKRFTPPTSSPSHVSASAQGSQRRLTGANRLRGRRVNLHGDIHPEGAGFRKTVLAIATSRTSVTDRAGSTTESRGLAIAVWIVGAGERRRVLPSRLISVLSLVFGWTCYFSPMICGPL